MKISRAPLYGLSVLMTLSPFHGFFRLTFPDSLAVLLWRDVLAYLILVLAFAFGAIRNDRFPRHWVNGTLLLFIAWGLLMVPFSENLVVGLYGFRTVVRHAPLYFAALLLIRSERDIRLLSRAMVAGAVILAGIGVYQWLDPAAPLFRMFEDSGVPSQRFGHRPLFGVYFQRIYSIYMAGVGGFAIHLTICTAVLLYAMRSGAQGFARRFHWLLGGMLAFVILLSGSRAGWVGFGIMVFLTLRRGRARGGLIDWFKWPIVTAVAAPLIYNTFLPEPERPGFVEEAIDRSLVQLQAYANDPLVLLFGHGYSYGGYAGGSAEKFQAKVLSLGAFDSQWLFSIMQIGLIGTLPLALTLVGFIALAYRMHRRCLRHPAAPAPTGLIWHPTALLGAFLLVALSSFHSEPLNYQGPDVNFYVIGAITVWYSRRLRFPKTLLTARSAAHTSAPIPNLPATAAVRAVFRPSDPQAISARIPRTRVRTLPGSTPAAPHPPPQADRTRVRGPGAR